MTRNEAIERIGGRKRAAGIIGAGCAIPALLACGLLFGGVGWAGSLFASQSTIPKWGKYEPYTSATDALANCGSDEYVLNLPRGGYACAKDY